MLHTVNNFSKIAAKNRFSNKLELSTTFISNIYIMDDFETQISVSVESIDNEEYVGVWFHAESDENK